MAIASRNKQLTPRSSDAYSPGNMLGEKYRLERVLGQGGIGQVWLARNVALDMPVALKILRPESLNDDSAARLLTEARVEAKLAHPHVVRVLDCGESDTDDPYIVMEMLEGQSLGDLLEKHGKLEPKLVVQVMLPVIDALAAAHHKNVVHRDLKPENIFVAREAMQVCPKVLDFGVAKLMDAGAAGLTTRGQVLGSPAYMSPEQARGRIDIDARSDIWATCVVLYEAISGRPPFDADNSHAVLRAVIERDPAPLGVQGCETLWPIIRRGLFKRRDQRYQTMEELGVALAEWLGARGVTTDISGMLLAEYWGAAGAGLALGGRPRKVFRRRLRETPRSSGVRRIRSRSSSGSRRVSGSGQGSWRAVGAEGVSDRGAASSGTRAADSSSSVRAASSGTRAADSGSVSAASSGTRAADSSSSVRAASSGTRAADSGSMRAASSGTRAADSGSMRAAESGRGAASSGTRAVSRGSNRALTTYRVHPTHARPACSWRDRMQLAAATLLILGVLLAGARAARDYYATAPQQTLTRNVRQPAESSTRAD